MNQLLKAAIFVLLVPCVSFAESPGPLSAGAAAVDITPLVLPINMPGGFNRNEATSIHDPFFARALTLSDGTTMVSLVVVDNLGADPSAIEAAKKIASQKTGVPTSRMLVCSTHTHSGPPTSDSIKSEAVVAYRERFINGLANSIVKSHASLQPARFGAASHPLADEVFNRRWYLKPGKMPTNPFGKMDQVKMNPSRSPGTLDRPAAPTDPDITVISIQNARGKPLSLFANYSLHYVGAVPRHQMSADYFGEFARLMPTRLRGADDFVAMMSNGTSGDINNIPFGVTRPPREPFEQIRIVAAKAADTAWFAQQKIQTHAKAIRIAMVQRELKLQYRRPTEEELAYAKKVLAMSEEEARKTMPRLARIYAQRTMRCQQREEDSVIVKLQAIQLGDLCVCGIPFETLVEIGLELKQKSPFPQTMVIGLANGRYGYLPTPRQHRLGGYETWLGTNYVQKDASVLITKNLLEMMNELKL